MREISQILREHYHFKYIPNYFFKQKPKLLIDPQKIFTTNKYTFSITDNNIAKEFVQDIATKYYYNLSLNPNIMVANLMDKPELLENYNNIQEFNLTILITTPLKTTN